MNLEEAKQWGARKSRLENIGEADPSYGTWKSSMEAAEEDFEAFAGSQPEEIRNMLWCYAGGAKMMHQRLMNLVCQNMRFPDEIPPK